MDVILGTRLKKLKSVPKEIKWKRNGSSVCFIIWYYFESLFQMLYWNEIVCYKLSICHDLWNIFEV